MGTPSRTATATIARWRGKEAESKLPARGKPKLRVAPESAKRLKEKLRPILRRGRGQRLTRVIEELKPILRAG